MRKLSSFKQEKPWAKLRVTRRQYESFRPWIKAKMSRTDFEACLLLFPDEAIEAIQLEADAEKLIDAIFTPSASE